MESDVIFARCFQCFSEPLARAQQHRLGVVHEATPLKSGVAAPTVPDVWYLRTRLRAWVSLVVLSFCFSFAQGPLASFQILEPAIIDDGPYRLAHIPPAQRPCC